MWLLTANALLTSDSAWVMRSFIASRFFNRRVANSFKYNWKSASDVSYFPHALIDVLFTASLINRRPLTLGRINKPACV